MFADSRDQIVCFRQTERERLLNKHGLAELERLHDRYGMSHFDGRYDNCVDFGMGYRGKIIGRVKLSADSCCEFFSTPRIPVGDRKKADGRMCGSHEGTQRADAP